MSHLMKLQEVAKRLGVSEKSARRYVKSGEIPSVFVGNAYRISEQDLVEYLEHARVRAGESDPKAQAPLPLEAAGDYQGWAAFVGELATDLEDWGYALHGGDDPAELPEREFLVFVGGLSAAGATYQRVRTVADALTQDEQLTRAWRRLSRVILAMSTPAVERRVEQLTGADELPDNVRFLRDVRTA